MNPPRHWPFLLKGLALTLACLVFWGSVLGLLSSVLGCASSPSGHTVTLERLPAWQAPQVERAEFSALDVLIHAGAVVPGAVVETSDARFTVVHHETMLAVLRWADRVYRSLGHGYTVESWDCDKFAKAYTLAVEFAAAKAGVKAQPLAARLYVAQRNAFGGVGGDALSHHALVGVRTDRGYYVLEPQPGALIGVRVVPLADYPNKILRIKLGG